MSPVSKGLLARTKSNKSSGLLPPSFTKNQQHKVQPHDAHMLIIFCAMLIDVRSRDTCRFKRPSSKISVLLKLDGFAQDGFG